MSDTNDTDDVLRVPVVKSVSPCKSAIETARRKERERIIGWLSDDDLDTKMTIQQVIDEIRTMPIVEESYEDTV